MRIVYLCLGWMFVGIGVVGAFLPVLPTTPFLLLALGCFARSSPRLEQWLLSHRTFGKPLRDWKTSGAISRRAKVMAVGLMAASYALFWFSSAPPPLRALIVAVLIICPAIFVATRPEPRD